MMKKILSFLSISFPWLITLFLWRLSINFWNPAGLLALIPVFYYTFIKKTDYFVIFGAIICFLIDYRSDLTLFWTFMFCLIYAINCFQNYIDVEHSDNNGLYIFMFFIGFCFTVLTFCKLDWTNIINNIWLFAWISILYTPITALDKQVHK